jgi:hypothetical protein
MNKNQIIILIIGLGVLIGLSVFLYTSNESNSLETGIQDNIKTTNSTSSEKIMTTDGIKHTVPLEEIMSGGPPKDGIPSIDDPKFVSAENVDYLDQDSPGISVSLDGVNKFYPYSILVWHEIVNDKINGRRILVTYCPLCRSGVVYDPVVQVERVEFGTSGKLWQSNLVMYDRKTDSLWSQILGEAIKGKLAGEKLEKIPSEITKFGEWKQEFSKGKVLSQDTGFSRDYNGTPYGNYHKTESTMFPTKSDDARLNKKELVIGIVVDGKARAYHPPAIKQVGKVTEEFQGKTIVAEYNKNLESVRIYEQTEAGKTRLPTISSYWFSWSAAYPNTKLYK